MNIALKIDETVAAKASIPLVVDLDGTLVATDLLYESFFDALPRHGLGILSKDLIANFSRQALKARLAELADIDYARLPYNESVLDYIRQARSEGRPVYLATASNKRHADAIAAHLGLFDAVFASDDSVNLRGRHKAEFLVSTFGNGGFDYIGNDASDLKVWEFSDRAISIGLDAISAAKLVRMRPQAQTLPHRGFEMKALIKAMRPHQYAKNALIFVPMLTAHFFYLGSIIDAMLAFVAFSLCASSVYLMNDILDIQSDRGHATKKNRPFASGRLSIMHGLMLVPGLLLASTLIGLLVSPLFTMVLAGYFVLTTAYSLSLKRKMVVDVVVLAMLYAVRVVAGGVAIGIGVSAWLLAFSLMVFTALALIKRYIELANRLDEGLDDPTNRNYKKTDLPVIAGLAAAAGMNSITIIALYIQSPAVQELYTYPVALWGLCPLLLYWMARAVMLAHRRLMDEDPISFALKDPRSWVVGAAAAGIIIAAY